MTTKEQNKKMLDVIEGKKNKTYYISIDLNTSGIEAKDEEEAYKIANELIANGDYSLSVADVEEN